MHGCATTSEASHARMRERLGESAEKRRFFGARGSGTDPLNSYPGRFTTVSPAAVELHVTMSAARDCPVAITLSADKEGERSFAPTAEKLGGCLLLEDRGYQSQQLFRQFAANDVSFIVRGTKNIRPVIRVARDHRGHRRRDLRRLEGLPLSWQKLEA